MKALIVFAAFGLVLANGFRLPFRVFGEHRARPQTGKLELRKFEDDTKPKEAERNFYKDDDNIDEDERDYAGVYGEDDENEYEEAFDLQEYGEEDFPLDQKKRGRRQALVPGPAGIEPSGEDIYGPDGPP